MRNNPGELSLFLYGTLRAGERLEGLLPDHFTRVRYGASVPGRLHYSPVTNGYPVLIAPDASADRVTGEVVNVRLDDPDVLYVMDMELSSGYSLTWVPALIPYAGGIIPVLCFTWDYRDGIGARVPGDDWKARNRYECSECGAIFTNSNRRDECEWSHDYDDLDTAMAHAIGKENA